MHIMVDYDEGQSLTINDNTFAYEDGLNDTWIDRAVDCETKVKKSLSDLRVHLKSIGLLSIHTECLLVYFENECMGVSVC